MSEQQGQALVAVLVVMTVVSLLAGTVAFAASALLAQQRRGAGDPVQADFAVESAVAAAVAQVQADPRRCPSAPRRSAGPTSPATATSPATRPSPASGERQGEGEEGRTGRPTPAPSSPEPPRPERRPARTPGTPLPTAAPTAAPTPTASPPPAPALPIVLPGGARSQAGCLRLDGVVRGPGAAPLDRPPGAACAVAVLPALPGRAWIFFSARWEGPGAAWVDARRAPTCAPPSDRGCWQPLPAGSPALAEVALDCDLGGLEPPVLHLAGASARSVLYAAEGAAGTPLYLLAAGTGSGGEEVVLAGRAEDLVLRYEGPVP
jgi:hypothetical protein